MITRIGSNPFLPKGIHYVTQAGLFAGKSTIEHITRFLGEHSSVTPIVNPMILFARNMQEAKTWFSKKVDSIRKRLAQSRLRSITKELSSRKEISDRKQWVKRYFSLKERSDLSPLVERYVLNLLDKGLSRFTQQVFGIGMGIGGQLSEILTDYQENLLTELDNACLTSGDLHQRKICNGVFDMLTPRVAVLGGHSQGGLTALQSLQEENNDIAMVLGWGMPTNGVNPDRVPASWLLKKVCPMIGELITGSPELMKAQNSPCPFDTTIVAIDSKDQKDGVILPNNLSPNILNAHYVEVGPRRASATTILGGIQTPIGYLLDYPPWFLKARAERNLYHFSYLDEKHIPYFFSEEEGSLVYEFAIGGNAIKNAIRLLHPSNYGGLQSGYLQWLLEKIKSREIDYDFSCIKPRLEELSSLPLPFKGSEHELAQEVFSLI